MRISARRRRVLGEDHPDTLGSVSNLAVGLYVLGEYQAARELDEDVLARRCRVLGEDHPDTLGSISNLAGACGQWVNTRRRGNCTRMSLRGAVAC